jgi:hypothetical protein
VPRSLSGWLLASVAMVCGLMIIALPITVIGTNVSNVYREAGAKRDSAC